MLTELCQYLKNWFELDQIIGKVTITDNTITVVSDGLLYDGDAPTIFTGQYVRIIGSVFNDGVIQYGVDELTNEEFDGAIWLLGIPKAVIDLAEEIKAWKQKYEKPGSPALSPFQSESFKGYSYSKGSASSPTGMASAYGWQNAYGPRLSQWRKI